MVRVFGIIGFGISAILKRKPATLYEKCDVHEHPYPVLSFAWLTAASGSCNAKCISSCPVHFSIGFFAFWKRLFNGCSGEHDNNSNNHNDNSNNGSKDT